MALIANGGHPARKGLNLFRNSSFYVTYKQLCNDITMYTTYDASMVYPCFRDTVPMKRSKGTRTHSVSLSHFVFDISVSFMCNLDMCNQLVSRKLHLT